MDDLIKHLIASYLRRWPAGYLEWRKSVKVLSERGDVVPLASFPWHSSLYEALDHHGEIGLLKPRKEGVTTEAVALFLYLGMWNGGQHPFYSSYNEKETFMAEDSFKSRLAFMYRMLQEEHPWQCEHNPVTNGQPGHFGTEQEVTFEHHWTLNGKKVRPSSLFITTATPNAGASQNFTLAWLDEIHRYEAPERTWAAVVPSTVNSGGPIIHTGTLYPEIEPGTFGWARFEDLYYGRRSGVGLFIGYGSRPGETQEAYAQKLADAQSPRDLEALHKLYPRNIAEALEVTGGGLFTAEELARCCQKARPLPVPERFREWERV